MKNNKLIMNKFWLGLSIGIMVGAASLLSGVMIAAAQTAETTMTVVILDEVSSASVTASVACNEVNCPEEVEEVGFFTSIINWFQSLWTGQN